MVRLSQRREMARHAVTRERTTTRYASTTFGVSETCYRYMATRAPANDTVAHWLLRLTTESRT